MKFTKDDPGQGYWFGQQHGFAIHFGWLFIEVYNCPKDCDDCKSIFRLFIR